MRAGVWACLASGLACAAAVALGPHQGDTALNGAQLSGMQVEAIPGAITLSNVRLHGVFVAGVNFLAQQETDQPATAAAGEPLDWEQRWDTDGSAASSFRASAALPAALSGQASSLASVTVEAYCQDCGGYTGSLGSTAVQLPAANGSLSTGNGRGTIMFLLRGFSSSAGGASASHTSVLPAARLRTRSLQQLSSTASPSPLPDCSLSVDPQQPVLSFQGCQSVPLQPGALYHVFYSLEPGPGGGTLWRGGLKINTSAVGGQWAGFGFPQNPGSMLGTEAVIVKECSSCPSGASVDGYLLKGYDPAANKAGSFKLTDASAARAPDGTLVAAFTAERPQPPTDLLASPFNFIYAIGPLASDGSLLPHPSADRPYGSNRMPLQSGMAGDGAGGPPPAAGAVPAPAGTSQGGTDPPPVDPPPAVSPPSSEAAASNGSSSCQLSLGSRQLSFAACTSLASIAPEFELMWTLEPSGTSMRVLTLGLQAPARGWVGVGFPATPGHMLGSTAMILKACTSCASGADIHDYFLAERSPAGVQPPGKLPVSGAEAAFEGTRMQGTIRILLDSKQAANAAFPIICAAGRLDSGGGLQYHDARGSTTVNWESGTSSGVVGDAPHVLHLKNAHGWLMAIGWGVLIPLGILTARHAKRWDPLWFHLHRAMQLLGLSCALAGFIIIFYAVQDATGTSVSIFTMHRRLGISAMSLGLFQLSALLFRPHKGTRLRPYWEFVHHWVGRAAALCAVANIYEGILNVRQLGAWAVATYSVVFGLIAGTGLALDCAKLLRRYGPAGRHNNNGTGDASTQLGPEEVDGAAAAGADSVSSGGKRGGSEKRGSDGGASRRKEGSGTRGSDVEAGAA